MGQGGEVRARGALLGLGGAGAAHPEGEVASVEALEGLGWAWAEVHSQRRGRSPCGGETLQACAGGVMSSRGQRKGAAREQRSSTLAQGFGF